MGQVTPPEEHNRQDSINELLGLQGPPTLGHYDEDDVRPVAMDPANPTQQMFYRQQEDDYKLHFNYEAGQAGSHQKQPS